MSQSGENTQTRTTTETAPTSVDDDATDATEDEFERMGTRRAAVSAHYERHRAKLRANAQPDAEDSGTSTWQTWRQLLRQQSVTDIVQTLWQDRFATHQRTITGIETDPELDDTSLDAASATAANIKFVRFELDHGDAYTVWYEWEPEDPDHPLNQWLDYYANGDLVDVFGTTVDVEYHQKNDYSTDDDDALVLYPTPYESRFAHYRYPILRAFMSIDDPMSSTYTQTDCENLSSGLLNMNNRFYARGTQRTYLGRETTELLMLPFASVGYIGVALLCGLLYMGLISPALALLCAFVAVLVSLVVPWQLIKRFENARRAHFLDTHLRFYIGGFEALIAPVRLPYRAGRWGVRRLIARIDSFNPYEQGGDHDTVEQQ